MQAGYFNPDWGMAGWYNAQDKAAAFEAWQDENAVIYEKDCRAIAKKLASEYRTACEDCETDAEFLASENYFVEWLLDECDNKDLREAMQYHVDNESDFTTLQWVLATSTSH